MSSYNQAIMSGFIPADSIMVGWLQDGKTPAVRCAVVSGRLGHTVFVVNRKLGAKLFAWKLTMDDICCLRVHVVVTSDVISHGYLSTLVASNVDFHTSNPDLRDEVDRRFNAMLAGKSPFVWPDRKIRIPGKVLKELTGTGGHS